MDHAEIWEGTIWNAVLAYVQLFEAIFKYLKISLNGLKISSNHLKISSNELKISSSKIEKVPRGIRGEKSSKDMASSRNLVSTIGALASPKMGDGTRCPEG